MTLATINSTVRAAIRVGCPLVLRAYITFKDRTIHSTFAQIYETNKWGGASRSGRGSDLSHTAAIRTQLPQVLSDLGIRSLLDIPCGDYYWMRHVDLRSVQYIGADIVPQLIEKNRHLYATSQRRFEILDLTKDPLPRVDLILCRDCLVHLSNRLVLRSLRSITASGSKYMLATTFPRTSVNLDNFTGGWRPLNLTMPPFGLPAPHLLICEALMEGGHTDKSVGLWEIDKLPRF